MERQAPAIEKILSEDERRRAAALKDRYYPKKPRIDCPAAVRRVQIINALLLMMARIGCAATIDADRLAATIDVADTPVSVMLSAKGYRPARHLEPSLELADTQSEVLLLVLGRGVDIPGVARRWADAKDRMLEQQLPDIAVEILVWGEMSYRASIFRHRQSLIKLKEALEAEELKTLRAAQRAEEERLAELLRVRREHLLQLAHQLREAEEIRSLVDAMSEARAATPGFEEWRSWAIDVANQLDPRLLPLEYLMPPATEPETP